MKHPFIIVGSLGIVVVIGAAVWVYFMLFYTHTTPTHTAANPFSEASSSKGFDALAQERAAQATTTTPEAPSTGARLLTLRKTIGAVALADGTYRFVEAGTGHIYQVDNTGSETKLSGTTFPGARRAVWSREGTRVAIVRETENGSLETFNGVLQKDDAGTISLDGAPLKDVAENVSYSESGDTLFYTRENSLGVTEGVSINLKTNKTQTLFTTPLHNIIVSWEPSIIMTTKASAVLPGYAYGKDGVRITDSMNALTAAEFGATTLFSGRSGNNLSSWVQTGARTTALAQAVIPEKCARNGTVLICAVPTNFEATSYPDAWYRGEIEYSDSLWQLDIQTGSSTQLFDFEGVTKKQIDVRAITTVKDGYLLEGKNDDSLWFVQNTLVQ